MKNLLGAGKTAALVTSAFINGALVVVVALETAMLYLGIKDEKKKERERTEINIKRFADAYKKEHGDHE